MAVTLRYDGSIPVPPCHENIKYLVLGQARLLECLEDYTFQTYFVEAATSPYLEAIPVLRDQAKALEETLRCWAGGVSWVSWTLVASDPSQLICWKPANRWKEQAHACQRPCR